MKNAVFKIFKKSKDSSNGRYEIINVGSGRPVNLNTIIQILEKVLEKKQDKIHKKADWRC